MEKESFIFHSDTLPVIEAMTDAQAGKLLKALCMYKRGLEVPKLTGSVYTAFILMSQMMDRDNEKFLMTVEKRRAAGHIGGKKSAENRSKTKQNQANQANATFASKNEANQAESESESESESVSVSPKGDIKNLSLSAGAREELLKDFSEDELSKLEEDVRVYYEARPDSPFSNMADEIRKFARNQSRWGGPTPDTSSRRAKRRRSAAEILAEEDQYDSEGN